MKEKTHIKNYWKQLSKSRRRSILSNPWKPMNTIKEKINWKWRRRPRLSKFYSLLEQTQIYSPIKQTQIVCLPKNKIKSNFILIISNYDRKHFQNLAFMSILVIIYTHNSFIDITLNTLKLFFVPTTLLNISLPNAQLILPTAILKAIIHTSISKAIPLTAQQCQTKP